MWALILLIVLIIVFIASIMAVTQGNTDALWFVFMLGAIIGVLIFFIIASLINALRYDKSKKQQDKNQSLEQQSTKSQEQDRCINEAPIKKLRD